MIELNRKQKIELLAGIKNGTRCINEVIEKEPIFIGTTAEFMAIPDETKRHRFAANVFVLPDNGRDKLSVNSL